METETAKREKIGGPPQLAEMAGKTLDGGVMEALLDGSVKLDASDLHLTVGQHPIYRVHGRLRELAGYREVTHEDMIEGVKFFIGDDLSNVY